MSKRSQDDEERLSAGDAKDSEESVDEEEESDDDDDDDETDELEEDDPMGDARHAWDTLTGGILGAKTRLELGGNLSLISSKVVDFFAEQWRIQKEHEAASTSDSDCDDPPLQLDILRICGSIRFEDGLAIQKMIDFLASAGDTRKELEINFEYCFGGNNDDNDRNLSTEMLFFMGQLTQRVPSLDRLEFNEIQFTRGVVDYLRNASRTTKWEFRRCIFSADIYREMLTVVKERQTGLHTFECNLGEESPSTHNEMAFPSLFTAIEESKSLHTLKVLEVDAYDSDESRGFLSSLGSLVANCKALEMLRFCINQHDKTMWRSSGCDEFIDALRRNNTLKELQVHHHSGASTELILSALEENTTLRCFKNARGRWEQAVDHLPNLRGLRELELDMSGIQSDSQLQAMQKNTSLTHRPRCIGIRSFRSGVTYCINRIKMLWKAKDFLSPSLRQKACSQVLWPFCAAQLARREGNMSAAFVFVTSTSEKIAEFSQIHKDRKRKAVS